MDKSALRDAIVKHLEAELTVLVAAANASKDEATDQDSRQEGKFDMRGQSAAYLAAGQAKLAGELAEAISAYRLLQSSEVPANAPTAVGTAVTLESRGQKSVFFIGPARGGVDLVIGGLSVTVITAGSPLGRQILGRRAGETIVLAGSRDAHLIVAVE